MQPLIIDSHCHAGKGDGLTGHWKAQQSFIDKLVKHPNVYTHTSGVRRFDLLNEAYERAGAHKILFGTDGPWLHPAVEIAKVYALKCNPFEEQQILSGNFLKLQHKRKQSECLKEVMN